MISKRLTAVMAALAAITVVLTGCGSPASSSALSGASDAGGGSAVQTTAKAKAAEYEKGPASYPGPTSPVNPGTGKAAVLVCGNAAPVCAQQGQVAVDALKAMGWEASPPVDGQFSPQVQGAFLDRAVQDRLDGVILVAIDVNTIKAAAERAASAGLHITCVQCLSGSQWDGKVHDVTADFYGQGVTAGWQMIAEKGDKAKISGFEDAAFSSALAKMKGVRDTIAQNCPNCTADIQPFAGADASKPGPPAFTAYLASHPQGTIDFMVGHYDGLSTIMTKTTMNMGRKDFLIGGLDGSPDGLNTLASSNPPMNFDVAEPFSYEEWAAADLLARMKAGAPLWSGADKMPSTLITKNNVQKFISQQPDSFPGPENYQANFLKLWAKG